MTSRPENSPDDSPEGAPERAPGRAPKGGAGERSGVGLRVTRVTLVDHWRRTAGFRPRLGAGPSERGARGCRRTGGRTPGWPNQQVSGV
ncbi:hypothetical protein GCM10010336_55400 [Streptomyces goshikiensis]|nr:hypothetical protein GCM10010336_55400 [Streptomyces goshikiensis]